METVPNAEVNLQSPNQTTARLRLQSRLRLEHISIESRLLRRYKLALKSRHKRQGKREKARAMGLDKNVARDRIIELNGIRIEFAEASLFQFGQDFSSLTHKTAQSEILECEYIDQAYGSL